MQLYLKAGFSSPAQASFFFICAGYNVGAGYYTRIMPKPVQLSAVTLNSKSNSTEHFNIVKNLLKLFKLLLKRLAS